MNNVRQLVWTCCTLISALFRYNPQCRLNIVGYRASGNTTRRSHRCRSVVLVRRSCLIIYLNTYFWHANMRFTATILAVLILVLSCLPCADIDAITPSLSSTEVSKSSQQHHEQHEGKDLCSPFCHCSCCSTFSVLNIPIHIPVLLHQPVCVTHTLHVSDAVTEISLPIWQPPQLV